MASDRNPERQRSSTRQIRHYSRPTKQGQRLSRETSTRGKERETVRAEERRREDGAKELANVGTGYHVRARVAKEKSVCFCQRVTSTLHISSTLSYNSKSRI
jgi:predicted thioesterase